MRALVWAEAEDQRTSTRENISRGAVRRAAPGPPDADLSHVADWIGAASAHLSLPAYSLSPSDSVPSTATRAPPPIQKIQTQVVKSRVSNSGARPSSLSAAFVASGTAKYESIGAAAVATASAGALESAALALEEPALALSATLDLRSGHFAFLSQHAACRGRT